MIHNLDKLLAKELFDTGADAPTLILLMIMIRFDPLLVVAISQKMYLVLPSSTNRETIDLGNFNLIPKS